MTLPKTKSCPKCKKTKDIDQFGTRMMDGVKRPQSYCLDCRNAHGKLMAKRKSSKKISRKGGKKK